MTTITIIQPKDLRFKKGWFTEDGQPVSGETLAAWEADVSVRLVRVKQDHPGWDEATWTALGRIGRKWYRSL